MENILGLDLGTSSIGISVRNPELGINIKDQLSFYQSDVFPSGVGNGKSGEIFFAAERTKKRSPRHLIWARKNRLWATLELLINNGYCPLSIENLDKWRKYDKDEGFFREYPIEAVEFEQWIRLDFNGDGVADYSSPYQLRAELMNRQFDFSVEVNRFKLGRALYHIAQRRGFKSSKGETLKEQESEEEGGKSKEKTDSQDVDLLSSLKKSEEKTSGLISDYMKAHHLPTVGCALAKLEKEGIRVRNSEYKAVRSQYKAEITAIFEYQEGLDTGSDFFNRLVSEKKHYGTIFYKRPLKSQKGLVGKCTLEPSKPRCAISHPDFEKYRAWCLINNIQMRQHDEDSWLNLDLSQKERLYQEYFLEHTSAYFKMSQIKKWLENTFSTGMRKLKLELNYKDDTSVSGCPVSANLKKILGADYETKSISATRVNPKTGESYNVKYGYVDLWHICFCNDEPEEIEEIADILSLDADKKKALLRLWGAISQGYSNLSLKAIRNITRFLERGMIYTDSVFLAKLPDIFGDKWTENENSIIEQLAGLIDQNKKDKEIFGIANTLISKYKTLEINDQFANHNVDYKLDETDLKLVKEVSKEFYGEKSWSAKSKSEQLAITNEVARLYQEFFAKPNHQREYYPIKKMAEALSDFLQEKYSFLDVKKLNKIYHPSMIEIYPKSKEENIGDGVLGRLLQTPTIGAIKNPLVMRVLHILRKQVNSLIKAGIVDEHTRVVVELARDVNDANMRWAIRQYQNSKEKENKEIIKILKDEFNIADESINDDLIDKVKIWGEQYDIAEVGEYSGLSKQEIESINKLKTDVSKYKLWKEQGCRCVYTGRMIKLSELFDSNRVDFEHTIPRSISFDNSLSNLTICDAQFNRAIKGNKYPTQLSNYSDIKDRIQPWIDRVELLKDRVRFWKSSSKKAATKERKDYCIQQRHLFEFELDYWQKKVSAFMVTEYKSGFRNSQINDTRIISKYAFHYLKSVFDRVDVQKGEVTAAFRKILGIQSLEEKKSRDKHSHHAIDATVLTLIPTPARREAMLKLFYEREEELTMHGKSSKYAELDAKLKLEIKRCGFGSIDGLKDFIENNILINHISKDQTLTPTSRKVRVRGKIVPKRDNDGNIIYEKDAEGNLKRDKFGNLVPEARRKVKGDCIRGQLHKDTFFGAIKLPEYDENGKPVTKDGNYVYPTKNDNEIITMVVRVPVNSFKAVKEFDKIIDPTIRETIKTVVGQRMSDGLTLEQALAQPIYAQNSKGEERKIDKNGRKISHIRHVRCKVPAGRGFMTEEKSIKVKRQTYESVKEYKNFYYAQNDGNYLCLLYEGIVKGKVDRKFVFVNYFEAASLKLKSPNDLYKEPHYKSLNDGKYNLSFIVKAGTKVLMWKDSPDEVVNATTDALNKRLYSVYKFNEKGAPCIYLQHHLEARENDKIKEDDTVYDPQKYQPRLTLVANNFNCLIEGRDFEFTENGIVFK